MERHLGDEHRLHQLNQRVRRSPVESANGVANTA
jgi:hypothetical protein